MGSILVYLLAAHAVCDYPLQGDWLSKAKNPTLIFDPSAGLRKPVEADRYSREMLEHIWPLALTSHALIQAVAVQLITGSWVLGGAEFVVHFATDWAKCRNWFGYNTDQLIHILCKCAWVGLLLAAGGHMP
jgi:hypothetical protein